MKKLLIVFTIVLLFLCSCSNGQRLLDYQSDIRSVTVKTDAPSNAVLKLDPIDKTITVLEPTSFSGTVISAGEQSYIEVGDLRIPLSAVQLSCIGLWLRAFELSTDELKDVSVIDSDGDRLTSAIFDCGDCEITVIYTRDGLPRKFEISSGEIRLSAEVLSIEN